MKDLVGTVAAHFLSWQFVSNFRYFAFADSLLLFELASTPPPHTPPPIKAKPLPATKKEGKQNSVVLSLLINFQIPR
jgi:hypothetical protein